MSGGTLCGVCTCFIVIPSFIMIMMSFSSLPTVEYGLDYNAITLTVDNRTYDSAGLYFLGLGHSFIKFPRTIQTIEFNAAHADLLHTRTLDGLPLTLGVSFQYRYIPQHLYELYRGYKLKHVHVYENTATAVIANVACNYSAYTFFNDKQGIATVTGRPHPNPKENHGPYTRSYRPYTRENHGPYIRTRAPSTRSRSPSCTRAGDGEGAGQDLRAEAVRAGGRTLRAPTPAPPLHAIAAPRCPPLHPYAPLHTHSAGGRAADQLHPAADDLPGRDPRVDRDQAEHHAVQTVQGQHAGTAAGGPVARGVGLVVLGMGAQY